MQPIRLLQNLLLTVLVLVLCGRSAADGLPDTLASIKSSIVAVGTHVPLRGSSHDTRGTGFVVAAHHAVSNAHAVPKELDTARCEMVAIFLPVGAGRAQVRLASPVRHVRALLVGAGVKA